MEKICKTVQDPVFLLGAGFGVVSASVAWYLLQRQRQRAADSNERAWSNKFVKQNMLELVGHTPIIRLNSLSQALGCEVFVGSA
jgi:hypothetical protein